MPFSPADSELFSPLFGDPQIAAVFSDARFIQTMLKVEAALARVESSLGLIPAEAAEQIIAAAAVLDVDMEQVQASTEKSGVPVIELVRQLRRQVGGEAASFVHWGATTQDIMDTAVVLQIRDALGFIEPLLLRLVDNLAHLADRHRHTLMAGRTHSQQALPIPFGLKVAGWLAPVLRHLQRLRQLAPRLLVVQFGGAAGTLAALGQSGVEVQAALAAELDLGVPWLSWHTQRDNLGELAGWLSLVSGSLAKMAQDIILMAQTEVAEARESGDANRGSSSTMPQKNNPIVSELIIAAARTNASLLSAMHQAMIQEHERATHGWQIEWLNLPQMFALTSAALNKAVFLSEHLVIDEEQMRANVAASNGLMLAEAITFALAPRYMSRAEAGQLVKEACQAAVEQKRHLVDVVREMTRAPVDWQALRDEANYLGASATFIDNVLHQANELAGVSSG